jgi:hypothetical protein
MSEYRLFPQQPSYFDLKHIRLQMQQQEQQRYLQEAQAQQMYYQQMHYQQMQRTANPSMQSYENFWTSIPGHSSSIYSEQSRQSYYYFPK